MTLPKKENPRKYTVTAKVTGDVYKALKQTATLEYGGNMSRMLGLIISDSTEAMPLPDEIYKQALEDMKLRNHGGV
jgi:hypothetical protein